MMWLGPPLESLLLCAHHHVNSTLSLESALITKHREYFKSQKVNQG